MELIKRLREQRVAAWNRSQEILKRAEDAEGGLSGELRADYDKADAEVARLTDEIAVRERHAEMEARLNAPREPRAAAPATAAEQRVDTLGDSPEYRAAFDAFLRRGAAEITSEQRSLIQRGYMESRDLGVATGAAGGYLVPQGFLTKITERTKYYSALRQLANVIETASGNAMPWPNNDDTGNVASILGENTSVTLTDLSFGTTTLNSYVWATGSKASLQLLNDSAFDVEAFIAKKFGQRFGRGQNSRFTVGSGTAEPLGITNNGAPSVNVFTEPTGNTTTITYNGLVETQHSVDRSYRQPGPKVGWMMHDTTMKLIRELKDSNNRPLWVPDTSFGSISGVNGSEGSQTANGLLLGYPVFINNDMDVPALSKYTAAFGDWESYYIIRDVVGVQLMRLNERYADLLQVGFIGFMRSDGRIDDKYAVSWHQQSAT